MIPFLIGLLMSLGSVLPFAQCGGTSYNWSGYVQANGAGYVNPDGTHDFQSVGAEWTVPTLDCAATPGALVAVWVGVNGYGANSGLFQTGTTSTRAQEGVLRALTPGGRMKMSITPRRRSTRSSPAMSSMPGYGATLRAIGLGRLEIVSDGFRRAAWQCTSSSARALSGHRCHRRMGCGGPGEPQHEQALPLRRLRGAPLLAHDSGRARPYRDRDDHA
jgi:hypothetical protein